MEREATVERCKALTEEAKQSTSILLDIISSARETPQKVRSMGEMLESTAASCLGQQGELQALLRDSQNSSPLFTPQHQPTLHQAIQVNEGLSLVLQQYDDLRKDLRIVAGKGNPPNSSAPPESAEEHPSQHYYCRQESEEEHINEAIQQSLLHSLILQTEDSGMRGEDQKGVAPSGSGADESDGLTLDDTAFLLLQQAPPQAEVQPPPKLQRAQRLSRCNPPEQSTSATSDPHAKPPTTHARHQQAATNPHLRGILLPTAEELHEVYEYAGHVLGKGAFGKTQLIRHRVTGEQFACKTMPKHRVSKSVRLISQKLIETPEDADRVRTEVNIMKHLNGHPNIVTLEAAYEDKKNVHLVCELCRGGELLERMVAKGREGGYSETQAAHTFRTMLQVIQHCHSKGVIHRDLKPGNFLLSSEGEVGVLKLCDFGFSVFWQPGEVLSEVVGTVKYMSPEMFFEEAGYGPATDMWSAGVILHQLLCGYLPDWYPTLEDGLDPDAELWDTVSSTAKDFLSALLCLDPEKRLTAEQALQHPWVKEERAGNHKLQGKILDSFKKTNVTSHLKKLALYYIDHSRTEPSIEAIHKQFATVDKDSDGFITLQELKEYYKLKGLTTGNMQIVPILLEKLDLDKDGKISFEEFVISELRRDKSLQDNMKAVFAEFDTNKDGFISFDEMREALKKWNVGHGDLDKIVNEVYQDGDGRFNYAEFVQMMLAENLS